MNKCLTHSLSTDKFRENDMFPKDFLYSFREYKEQEDFVVDPALRKAWSSFISEFCRSVSYHWKSYLGKIRNREDATFQDNLSTSDEAFAMWVVFCKYDEAKNEAEEIKSMGQVKWKETRKPKRVGPHDSKEHIKDYIKFYQQVKDNRRNLKSGKAWQDMFFDDLFQDPDRVSLLTGLGKDMNQDGETDKESSAFCLPGPDDDFQPVAEEHVENV